MPWTIGTRDAKPVVVMVPVVVAVPKTVPVRVKNTTEETTVSSLLLMKRLVATVTVVKDWIMVSVLIVNVNPAISERNAEIIWTVLSPMDYNMESVLMTYANPESQTIRRWYRIRIQSRRYRRRYRQIVSLTIVNRT